MEGEPFTPEVLFEGSYHPICGLNFWNDDEGANLVCQQLGMGPPQFTGRVTRTDAVHNIDAVKVGKCNANDKSVDICSGGGNNFGELSADDGACQAGNSIGVEVTCEYQQVRKWCVPPFLLLECTSDGRLLFVCLAVSKFCEF
jgi:hypothetical protein